MIKKIFLLIIAFVITVAAVVNFNMSSKKHDMTDVNLTNIEAIAQGEMPKENREDIWIDWDCLLQCFENSDHDCTYWFNDPFQC